MRPLRLSQNQHTGRKLPHHHTSYALLSFVLIVAGLVLLLFTNRALADPPPVTDFINVSAVVAPRLTPVILVPVNGQVFSAIPIEVSGNNCDPGVIVGVYSNGSFVGSTTCTGGGTFKLNVDLFVGANNLVARASDTLGNSTPDSNTVSVTYSPPAPPPPPPGQPVQKIPQLILRSDSTYKGVSPRDTVTWPTELIGGKGPYAISWNWGDGSVELISRSNPGVFTVSHAYAKPGSYQIIARATDNSGQSAYLELTVIVSGSTGVATTERHIFDGGLLLILWPLYVLIFLVMLSFWLGERYEHHRLRDEELRTGVPAA